MYVYKEHFEISSILNLIEKKRKLWPCLHLKWLSNQNLSKIWIKKFNV